MKRSTNTMKLNNLKRAAALLLTLALLLAVLPQTAPAVRAASNSGECGEDLTWRFDSRTGKLTISGEGDMWNFWGDIDRGDGSDNGVPWIAFLDQITALELPEGLTSVGDNAFKDCPRLQAAVIPENVTRIGWYAFNACADLNEIVLSEGITEIGAYAFSSCAGLTEVVLPSRLEYVYDEAFASCTALTAVTFLNPCCFITEDCLANCGEPTVYGHNGSAAELFAEEQGFPFVSLGDFTAEGVCGDSLTWSLNSGTGVLTLVGEGDMWSFTGFRGDGYLSCNTEPWRAWRGIITGLELPEGLTSIGDAAFNGCWKLESAVIPETVTRIGDYAFGACYELLEAVIPEGVTSIGESAFNFCESLPEVTLPASVERVDSWAFAFCFSLNDITFLNPACVIADDCLENTENATVYGYSGSTAESFAEARGIPFVALDAEVITGVCGDDLTWSFDPATGTLTIEGSGEMWDSDLDSGWHPFASSITSVILPEGLTRIGSLAFFECTALRAVTIPKNVVSIGTSSFSRSGLIEVTFPDHLKTIEAQAFEACLHLTAAELPDGLTTLGSAAFMGCAALRSVTVPGSITRFGNRVFSDCTALESLTLRDGLKTIGSNAFYGCRGLSSVTIPDSVTSIDELAFGGCTQLTSVTVPGSVRKIGSSAFAECTALTEAVICEGVTDIESFCFYKCASLTSVTLSSSVTFLGEGAFGYCSGLTEIALPENLSSLGNYVFEACASLRTVTIPEALRVIPTGAFLGCSGLVSVDVPETVTMIEGLAFSECDALKTLVIRNPLCWVEHEERFGYLNELDRTVFPDTLGINNRVTVFGKTVENPSDDFEYEEWRTVDGIVPGWNEYHRFLRARTYAARYGYDFCEVGTFSDVPAGKWYEIPVAWAYGNGITSGTGNGNFSPNQACTREQIVTFLWKAYGSPEAAGEELPFTDVVAGKYYEDAVRWAYHHDPQITGGMNGTTFGVGKPCTRAQVVTFLYAAAGKPEPKTAENPFTDVKETDYFYKAVLWAVENGITSGTTPTTFSPKQTCTRAQVVTFLYQAVG